VAGASVMQNIPAIVVTGFLGTGEIMLVVFL
jgi:hypothetical protein